MAKFCEHCGTELRENQDICLGCGRIINKVQIKEKNHNSYLKGTAIAMISLGSLLIIGSPYVEVENVLFALTLPGLVGLISGILSLLSKKNQSLLLAAGICAIVAAIINLFAIADISIYFIYALIFGIINIVAAFKE